MGPEPARLAAGDFYACPRCHMPHLVEQPFVERSTAERTHLYVSCQGAKYFVGQGMTARPERRGPEVDRIVIDDLDGPDGNIQ